MKTTLYDINQNNQVSAADLPEGLTPEIIDAFCEAHGYSFSSIFTPVKNEYDTALHPGRFRVAHLDDPSHGVSIAYELVSAWLDRVQNTAPGQFELVQDHLLQARDTAHAAKLFSLSLEITKVLGRLEDEKRALVAGKARLSL